MKLRTLVLLGSMLMFFVQVKTNEQVDFIVFSYHRPMQLYALLESVQRYTTGFAHIVVIYRADTDEYDNAYQRVKKDFDFCSFIRQSAYPYADFKPLVLDALKKTSSDYVCFGVDDIIVKDFIDLKECVRGMQLTNAFGCFLRLGKNLSYCFSMNAPQKVPPLQPVAGEIYAWTFNDGEYDWCYPFSLDMTIYQKIDIEPLIVNAKFKSPNSFESVLAGYIHKNGKLYYAKKGICYGSTKIVNIPLNIVQQDHTPNLYAKSYSAQELLHKFNMGFKIDIDPFAGINNHACHIAADIVFTTL